MKLNPQIVYLGVDSVQFVLQLPIPAMQSRLNQGTLKTQGKKARHFTHPLKSSMLLLLKTLFRPRGFFY